MKSRVRRTERGQSEVIAAMILIPLLIVVFSTIATSMFKTNVTGTSSLASRARFEQERSSESLQVVWVDENTCKVVNVGPLDVIIVRIWVNDDPQPLNDLIKKGEERMTLSNNAGVNEIDYAVTSRGNVYPLRSMCEQSRTIINYYQTTITGGSPFTSEDILNMTRLVGTDYASKKIITRVSGVGNASVLYWSDYPIADWYFNSGGGWVKDIDSYSCLTCNPQISQTQIDTQLKDNIDLDGNGVNEVSIVKVTTEGKNQPYILKLSPVTLGKGGNYDVNITFVNLLATRDSVDLIAIYFKLVAWLSTSPSQQIAVGSAAMLQGINGTAFASGSTAVGSYAKGSGSNIFIATGSIIFPVRAYDSYKKVILPNEDYNLTLAFRINIPSANPNLENIRIEYVAVTGAELKWRP
ncbi:MAG: hypothetical protein QXX81_06520 [Zestosphaera sp.]